MIPLWAYIVGGAATVSVAFAGGWKVREWRCESQIAAIERAAEAAAELDRGRKHEASAGFEAERAVIEQGATETRTIIQEVYRDVEVPADCAAPAAVVDSLRAATERANAATGQPSGTVREPSGGS